jgi:hypothetical protein
VVVSAVDSAFRTDRLLEVVEAGLEDFVRPGGTPDIGRLLELPTLTLSPTTLQVRKSRGDGYFAPARRMRDRFGSGPLRR